MISVAATVYADGIDVKVKGTWDFAFGYLHNKPFRESVNRSDGRTGKVRDNDKIESRQRVRTQVNFITSENLQAVLMFEIGDIDWGRAKGNSGRGSGGALDSDGVNIETRLAYLDWLVPNTDISVRMGLQRLTLPSGRMGNPVFDADVAGVVASSPITDWLSATGFWIRPFDAYLNDEGVFAGRDNLSDETDVFGLILPMSYGNISFTPYFAYGFLGANSGVYDYIYGSGGYANSVDVNSKAKVWWAGANFEATILDPLVLNIDAIYGRQQRTDLGNFYGSTNTELGTSGWYVGATLDYTLDWGTPGIFGWWASGDKSNSDRDGKYGRIPVLGIDGAFLATTFGAGGYYAIGNGGNYALVTNTGTGTWGVGIQLADVSFVEDLSHTLRFACYRGTNDTDVVKRGGNYWRYAVDMIYLTREDSVFEINFDHQYKIYDNLTAILELGYLRLSSDRDVWGSRGMNLKENDDAWKAEISFRYAF